MKHYEFINLHVGTMGGAKSEEHRQTIRYYAEMGFRYVGYIPTNMSSYGKIIDMDLVFEKDE